MSVDIVEKALAIARSKLGMKEQGQNRGSIVEWAMRPWSKAQVGAWAEWCAAFACTCYYEAGSIRIRRIASTNVPRLWKNCVDAGIAWEAPSDGSLWSAQPGDLIFFTGLGHVGIVEHVDQNVVFTLEGNHGDAVSQDVHKRGSSNVFGFARIE